MTDELQRSTLVGTQVSHYAIDRLLGRGGMSSVYLAIDSRTGCEVAMKILLHDLAGDVYKRQAQNLRYLTDYWWILTPGVFIFLAVMAWNVFGDGLRDAADPRTQR